MVLPSNCILKGFYNKATSYLFYYMMLADIKICITKVSRHKNFDYGNQAREYLKKIINDCFLYNKILMCEYRF